MVNRLSGMGADLRVTCRAPLIWILAPIIWGYVLGRYISTPESFILHVILGSGLALTCLGLLYTQIKYLHLTWAIIFMIAGTFISWGYFDYRAERISTAWPQLPTREAKLTLIGGPVTLIVLLTTILLIHVLPIVYHQ